MCSPPETLQPQRGARGCTWPDQKSTSNPSWVPGRWEVPGIRRTRVHRQPPGDPTSLGSSYSLQGLPTETGSDVGAHYSGQPLWPSALSVMSVGGVIAHIYAQASIHLLPLAHVHTTYVHRCPHYTPKHMPMSRHTHSCATVRPHVHTKVSPHHWAWRSHSAAQE